MHTKSRSTFTDEFLKNLVIIFVIIIIVVTLTSQMTNIIKNQEVENCKTMIKNGLNSTTNQLRSLESILSDSFSNQYLSRLSLVTKNPIPSDYILMNKAKSHVGTIVGSNSSIAEIVILFYSNDLVITGNHTFLSVDDFISFYSFYDFDIELFSKSNAKNNDESYVVSSMKFHKCDSIASPKMGLVETAFCYEVPIKPTHESYYSGTAYIFMRKEPILNSLLSSSMDSYGKLSLYDKNGIPFMTYPSKTSNNHSTNNDIILNLSNNKTTITCIAEVHNIYFKSIMSAIYHKVYLYIFIAVITGIALTVYVTYRQTKPLKRLVQELAQQGYVIDKNKNEYALLKNCFNKLEAEKDCVCKQVELYQYSLKNNLIDRLLHTSSLSENEINNILIHLPSFPKRFIVCYGQIQAKIDMNNRNLTLLHTILLDHFIKQLPQDTIFHNIEKNAFVLIYPCYKSQQNVENALRAILKSINSSFALQITIATSNIRENIQHVNSA